MDCLKEIEPNVAERIEQLAGDAKLRKRLVFRQD